MNDYKFGNLIYEKRKALKLSQNELANILGVTNKAISKWENGNAKPNIDILRKLSVLFNISIEELLNTKEEKDIKQITKIVITGGPCAGKTTALSKIEEEFTSMGYSVLFVSETATETINSGITASKFKKSRHFQESLLKLQLAKEQIVEECANRFKNDKILIVCDRGTMDSKAYLSNIDFMSILKSVNKSETQLRENYDAIFHLVTAAKGASEFYTLENNTARTETKEEAIIIDDKIIEAYTGHPHLRVIDNSTDFDLKIKKLIKEIKNVLGEPEHFEIERKFLIEYPNISWLDNNKSTKKVEIIQTYLKSNNDEEIRIRQRGIDKDYIYTKTIKKNINNIKRIEIESRLSKEEYLELLMDADTTKKQIRKTRYCMLYKNQYFEIDIFPFWKDKAILEIELNDENQDIKMPKQLKLIKEVTNDPKYKNSNIANY